MACEMVKPIYLYVQITALSVNVVFHNMMCSRVADLVIYKAFRRVGMIGVCVAQGNLSSCGGWSVSLNGHCISGVRQPIYVNR